MQRRGFLQSFGTVLAALGTGRRVPEGNAGVSPDVDYDVIPTHYNPVVPEGSRPASYYPPYHAYDGEFRDAWSTVSVGVTYHGRGPDRGLHAALEKTVRDAGLEGRIFWRVEWKSGTWDPRTYGIVVQDRPRMGPRTRRMFGVCDVPREDQIVLCVNSCMFSLLNEFQIASLIPCPV